MKFIRQTEITPLIRGVFRSYPLMFSIIAVIIGLVFNLNLLLFLISLILISSLFNKFISKNVLFKLFETLNLKHVVLDLKDVKIVLILSMNFHPTNYQLLMGCHRVIQ